MLVLVRLRVLDTDSIPTMPSPEPGGASLSRFWDGIGCRPMRASAFPATRSFFTAFGPHGHVGSSYSRSSRQQYPHHPRPEASSSPAPPVPRWTEEANARYFAEVMCRRHRQVFWQDSCQLANSYYFDKNGDVPLRPTTTVEAYWRSRRFDLRHHLSRYAE